MYPSDELLQKSEAMVVLSDEINSAMDTAWSDVRSYDTSENAWLMPVLVVVMLILAVGGFVRASIRKRHKDY